MNTASFDWTLVRSFLAALEHGSLLGAARVLNTSQPTVGRHMAELERQLGVVLFERTGRGLLPTDAALRLADAARTMQTGADALARSVTSQDTQITGTVRLSASQPVACYALPPVLAQMRHALPEVQVELVASNAVSNLLRREADIALRMVRPEQASLVAKRIATVRLGTYAHPDYLRRRGTPRDVADLLHHDIVGNDRMPVADGFKRLGVAIAPERFVLRSDDLIAYWQAVRAGLGIGFVAQHVARTDPQVQAVLPKLSLPTLPVWLTVHREIRTNARIRAVYDFLAQAVPAVL